jgi:hypothetical protein
MLCSPEYSKMTDHSHTKNGLLMGHLAIHSLIKCTQAREARAMVYIAC